MVRRKKVTKKRSQGKPIGFVKVKGGYKLVFGSKTKPRLGSSKFKTKANMTKKAKTLLNK